jgi:hypothetical protein
MHAMPYQRYGFYLPKNKSPTYYNLNHYLSIKGWYVALRQDAHFNEKHFDFHIKAAQSLEFKHLLAQLVAQHCPDVMPKTYVLDDYSWPVVLNQVAIDSRAIEISEHDITWILKPSLLNNGQNIIIFDHIKQLYFHFANPKRLGGAYVLQHYLKPHLLRDNRKYSLRQFVVLTNHMGCYLYHDGYFNIALHPYDLNQRHDLRSHLTNEHLHGENSNTIQIPSHRFDHYPALYLHIKIILKRILNGLKIDYPQAFNPSLPPVLALFGIDFMVDNTGQLWLLEANHGPCFPIGNHPLQVYLYQDFWQQFIDNFVLPIAKNQPFYAVDNHFFHQI